MVSGGTRGSVPFSHVQASGSILVGHIYKPSLNFQATDGQQRVREKSLPLQTYSS